MSASVQVRGRSGAVERWEQKAEVPLVALALLFLAAYAWPIIDPGLSPRAKAACEVLTWATWACFAVDYLARLWLSDARLRFIRRNVLDLAVLALPLLRPLRLLRLVVLVRILNRSATSTLRGRLAVYVGGATVLLGFVAALAVLDAERSSPDANIRSFSDALWWTATTMSTVGYGDRYPTTDVGRLVAVALMVSGIAVLGMVTATLASWISDRVREEAHATDALVEEIRELRRALSEAR